jgi:hypothetical protein
MHGGTANLLAEIMACEALLPIDQEESKDSLPVFIASHPRAKWALPGIKNG